jgi:Mce-associated membrane protein
MEGDAGASRRLNPTDADVTAEASTGSAAEAEKTNTVHAADSEVAQTQVADTPGDAEESAADAGDDPESVEAEAEGEADEASEPQPERRQSRLGLAWLAAVAAALVLLAGGVGVGGYLLVRAHQQNQETSRNNALALKAAVDCVSATQAPDTTAMVASEQKIIDCGTDDFRSQALLYTSMLVQAYQASNIHVQVSDVRAAVERDNPDGSVIVLVALRVKVNNDQSQNETGYRLRVKMASQEGAYKIAKLDQVTK